MSFGEWEDPASEKYSSNERFGQTAEELADLFEEADHPGWKSEFGYSLLELLYENAFEESGISESDAEDFRQNICQPLLDYCFGKREDLGNIDIEAYKDVLERTEGTNIDYGFEARLVRSFPSPRTKPYSFTDPHDFQITYEEINNQVESGAYDIAIGIWSSGIPVLDLMDHDMDEFIVRYSPSRGDEEVNVTPETGEKMDLIEDSTVLLVDDVVQSGESLRNVSKWVLEEGAESVDAFVATTKDWEISNDNEIFQVARKI